jgi:hypothetical protein
VAEAARAVRLRRRRGGSGSGGCGILVEIESGGSGAGCGCGGELGTERAVDSMPGRQAAAGAGGAGGFGDRAVASQIEAASKTKKQFIIIQFQAPSSGRFQRWFDRVNLYHLTLRSPYLAPSVAEECSESASESESESRRMLEDAACMFSFARRSAD